MITLMLISLIGVAILGRDALSGPEKMDAIPLALPVWKEPIVVSISASGSLQYMRSLVGPIRSIVRERRPKCFTTAVANCYKALLDRGYDQPSALMMAHENCDPDVCPYCTRPKNPSMQMQILQKRIGEAWSPKVQAEWARPVPIPEPPDGAMRCSHGVTATRCAACWSAKNPL